MSASSPAPLAGQPAVTAFFDPRTSSVQYIVADPATGAAVVIDPVLDFDVRSGSVATGAADAILAVLAARGLTLQRILDTHPHADHLTAAAYLKERTGVPTATGAKVRDVAALWRGIYNADLAADGAFDHLFADGERFTVGTLEGEVIPVPGHTLASVAYRIGDAVFMNDTLFMPDGGTARADFPGASARDLWRSIGRILALPDATRLFTGHDYQPGGRPPAWESTVAAQRSGNVHLTQAATEEAFVAFREARDRTLPLPALMLPALQVNLRGGRLPEPEPGGGRYLKIPLGAFPGAVW